MADITQTIVDAARLYGELKQQAEKEVKEALFATIKPAHNILHFSGLIIWVQNSELRTSTKDERLATWEIRMFYNKEEITFCEDVDINRLNREDIAKKLWDSIRIKTEHELKTLFLPEITKVLKDER